MTHFLKTWPQYFQRVLDGEKKFELRKNDRDFQVGDYLLLQEYEPGEDRFTGREKTVKVTYIINGGNFGLQVNHCVMSIVEVK